MAPEPEVPQLPLRRGPGRPRKSESVLSSPAMAPKKLPAQKDASKVTKDSGIRKTSASKPGSGPNVKYVKLPMSKNDASKDDSRAKLPDKPAEITGPNIKHVKKQLSHQDSSKKGPGRPPKSATLPPLDLFATAARAFSQPPLSTHASQVNNAPARSASSQSDAPKLKQPDLKKSAQALGQPRSTGGRFAVDPSKTDASKKNNAVPSPLASGFGAQNDPLAPFSMSKVPGPSTARPSTGGLAAQNTMSTWMKSQMVQMAQMRQQPRTPPQILFQERRDLNKEPIVFSPPIQGALQAHPENANITVGNTSVPVEEIHAFIRRFLRLQAITQDGKLIYPPSSPIHEQTLSALINLTMNWQSAHNLLAYDRFSLHYCHQNGVNVGTALVSRALATGLGNKLRLIMEFFDNQAKMANQAVIKASVKDKVDFERVGAMSWVWSQMMDREFFGAVRDSIIVLAKEERGRIDREREVRMQEEESRVREELAREVRMQKEEARVEEKQRAKEAYRELENRIAFVAKINGDGPITGEVESWDDMD
ncbi:uncharacterized protein PAC_04836 [Phialocephala subalpina]|uniref:Uncharacterized protein n=1 Tax=Phialocephala subalpina TaxID=576137 RepID=A0A1L7WQB6_9HELO|nr:uncharacterized protein PAC_04836 [Phialocephala subalpina]